MGDCAGEKKLLQILESGDLRGRWMRSSKVYDFGELQTM
jgi:hypothetical protein